MMKVNRVWVRTADLGIFLGRRFFCVDFGLRGVESDHDATEIQLRSVVRWHDTPYSHLRYVEPSHDAPHFPESSLKTQKKLPTYFIHSDKVSREAI